MQRKITIVGFGDSITEAVIGVSDENKRWLNILGRLLSEAFRNIEFNMVNSGVGGNSAREAMARFDKDVLAKDPDFVILEFGGNNDDPYKPERRVSYDEFRAILEKFKSSISAKTEVIVVTFPPVFEEQHSYSKDPVVKEYFKTYGGMEAAGNVYRNIVRIFADESGYQLCDLHKELIELGEKYGSEKYTLNDGVHLSENGNKAFAELVFRTIKNMIKK